jgi:hypothetical protein
MKTPPNPFQERDHLAEGYQKGWGAYPPAGRNMEGEDDVIINEFFLFFFLTKAFLFLFFNQIIQLGIYLQLSLKI